MELQETAKKHIAKAEQTIEYLRTKRLPQVEERKKQYILQDIEAMEFLIEQTKENLEQRGIRV